MHPCSFETSFDHQFVGTFHHARTNGPSLLLKKGILHQRFSFPEVAQMLTDPILFADLLWQTVGHAQQKRRTAMFEDMQTPFEHLRGKVKSGSFYAFEQLGQMLGRMGKIQNAQRIWSMHVKKGLQPVRPICHRTHLLGLDDLASPHLPFRQLRERLGRR
jgi:hypothetical protein